MRKETVQPMQPLVTCRQFNFGFKKIGQMIHICKEALEKTDELFQSVYAGCVSLANKLGVEETWSPSLKQQVNRNNIPSERFKEYWQRSKYLPFLDIAFAGPKTRSDKKGGHIINFTCSSPKLLLSMMEIRSTRSTYV